MSERLVRMQWRQGQPGQWVFVLRSFAPQVALRRKLSGHGRCRHRHEFQVLKYDYLHKAAAGVLRLAFLLPHSE